MTALLYATVYAPDDLPTEEAHIVSKSLGTVNEASVLDYKKHLRGAGKIKISINRHHPQAALLVADRYLIVHSAAGPVGGGFLDESTIDLSHKDGPGAEMLTWTGDGPMAILRNGRMDATSNITGGHDPIDGYWDLDNQGVMAGASNGHPIPMLKRALVEMQLNSPSGIAVVDHSSWTYDEDSAGATPPFIPGEVQGANVGDDGLSLIAQMSQMGDVIFQMSHLFKLDAYLTLGTDKSGAFGPSTVRFEKGVNVAEAIQRKVRGSVHVTHLIVGGAENQFVTVTDPDYVSGDVVRWGFLSVPETSDPDGLEAAGLAHIEARKRQTDTFQFPQHDHGDDPTNGIYEPGVHYDVGDIVSHHTGTGEYDADEQASPIAAITWQLKTGDEANGDYWVIPESGSTFAWDGDRAFEGNAPGSQHRFLFCQPGALSTVVELLAWDWASGLNEPVAAISSLSQPATTCPPAVSPGITVHATEGGYLENNFAGGQYASLPSGHGSGGGDPNRAAFAAVPGTTYTLTGRLRSQGGDAGWIRIAWLSGSYGSYVLESVDTSLNVAATSFTEIDGDFTAPVGATAGVIQFGYNTDLEHVTITTTTAGAVNDGHPDLIGTGSRASRCGHKHHVLRDTAPTVDDDWATAGYPTTTLWTQVDDTETPTAIVGTWLLIDASTGAAVWESFGGGGTDDQTAAEVPFTPTGTIAATNTQAAVAEVATDAAAALTTHAGAADPHTGYVKESEFTAAGDYLRGTGAGTLTVQKNNFAATTAPGVGDDSGDGYSVGSRWINVTSDKEYVALDVSVGAAVWTETTASPTGGTVDVSESDGTPAASAVDEIEFDSGDFAVSIVGSKASVAALGAGAGLVGRQTLAVPIGYNPAATNTSAPTGIAYMMQLPVLTDMIVRGLRVSVTVNAAGSIQWGLFDASADATAATKIAGGSASPGATGHITLAAAGAPVNVPAGLYILVMHFPAANCPTLRFNPGIALAPAGKSWNAGYVWDDTPDLTHASWGYNSAIWNVGLIGDFDGAGHQW